MEKEIFFDLNLEEEEMDDDVILRVVEDGAIAREKDNDEKDECAIIIVVVVVVVVVVAIFVLLFSLSFPCVFLLGEKKWRRREKGFHRNITSRKGGCPVSTSCLFQKKVLRPPPRFQKKKRKERKIWLDSIDFFTKDRGAKFYCDFPRFLWFFPV